MEEWAKVFCLYLVLGMGIGTAILILINIWWKVFDEVIKLFKLKKQFAEFLRNKIANKQKI